jgi:hypothetical protein
MCDFFKVETKAHFNSSINHTGSLETCKETTVQNKYYVIKQPLKNTTNL